MKRWLLALLLAVAPLAAQPEERAQKIVTMKYADPETVRKLLVLFGVETTADQRMKVLVLSGPKAKVAAAEDAIKQLDVPAAAQKDIDLMVYFVVGSEQALPSTGPNQAYGAIPAELQSTVATLKTAFPYKVYYLLDTLSQRIGSGARGASTTGQLGPNRFTVFSVRTAALEGDGTTIRLEGLHAGLRVPHNNSQKIELVDTGITTDVVTVKEGQRLVVGRSSLEGPTSALFVVLIGKVVN